MELQFVDRSRGSVAGAALMLVARRQVEVDGDRAFARPLAAARQGDGRCCETAKRNAGCGSRHLARLVAYGDLLGGAAGERQGQWLDREAVIGRGGEGDGDRQVAGIGQLDKASTARADEHRVEVDSLRCIGQPAPEAAAG